jgi:hypothetical protein
MWAKMPDEIVRFRVVQRPKGGLVSDLSRTVLVILLITSGVMLACNFSSYTIYIIQQVRETVDPEPAGWLVMSAILTANCFNQLSMGGSWWSIATVSAQAGGSFIIMGICIVRGGWRGSWQFTRADVPALIIAFTALLCAQLWDIPRLGVVLTLVAHSAGMYLIIRKAATVPNADRVLAWAINMGAGPPAIIAAIITSNEVMLIMSPLYLMAVDGLMVVAIRSKRWKRYDTLEATQLTEATMSVSA